MNILGIDEAGRGAVLGSMFIGGVLVAEDDMQALGDLGLKDSKLLNDAQREAFVPRIEELAAGAAVREVAASEIDELREIMSLNVIELKTFAQLIEQLEPDSVFIDLPEPDGERFVKKIKNELDGRFDDVDMVAEHEADDTYPIVSAASILAKSAREAHTAELKEKYGVDFRTGYSHDEDTITFLEDYLAEHGELPEETRLSWRTAQRIREEHEQSGIDDF